MERESNEYVSILETHNAGDRVLIRSILDAEGIVYFIQNEYFAHYLYNALPMRVMVRKDHEGKAREILKDIKLTYSFSFRKKSKDTKNNSTS
jgi:hypothetical protein